MRLTILAFSAAISAVSPCAVAAHDGPPFPIVSDRLAGAYRISVWADPDTTDDTTPGGQFWIRIDAARAGVSLDTRTRAAVSIRARDRAEAPVSGYTTAVSGDATNQFVAMRMATEGVYAVHVTVEGPLGTVALDADVTATYDARPSPRLLALYLAPFLLVGFLWIRLLRRRRAG